MTNDIQSIHQDEERESLISIIVPVYKVEQYLNSCMESITNQTYTNLEIIMVDDGSPDNCPFMCDEWASKDTRIQVIHKENRGLSDARNKGLEKAMGNYVAFIDSDDVIDSKYIEYLYEAIQEIDADFSECAYDRFTDHPDWDDKKKISDITLLTQEEILHKFCNGAKPNNHYVWNKLYKRELIENVLFAVGFQSQDILFCCEVFCKCKKAAHIDNVLYHYRIRVGSVSNAFVKQRFDAFEMTRQSLEYLSQNKPEYVKDLKSYYYSLILGAVDWIVTECPLEKRSSLLMDVNSNRKQVHLTRKEWKESSLGQKIKWLCSLPGVNIPSLRIRHFLSRIKLIKD